MLTPGTTPDLSRPESAGRLERDARGPRCMINASRQLTINNRRSGVMTALRWSSGASAHTVASESAKAGNMHDSMPQFLRWSPNSWFWVKKASWGSSLPAAVIRPCAVPAACWASSEVAVSVGRCGYSSSLRRRRRIPNGRNPSPNCARTACSTACPDHRVNWHPETLLGTVGGVVDIFAARPADNQDI